MKIIKKQTIIKRLASPTPSPFRKIRNMGLMLGAIGAALLTAPIALPAIVISIAGYLASAGLVASAVSQLASKE